MCASDKDFWAGFSNIFTVAMSSRGVVQWTREAVGGNATVGAIHVAEKKEQRRGDGESGTVCAC